MSETNCEYIFTKDAHKGEKCGELLDSVGEKYCSDHKLVLERKANKDHTRRCSYIFTQSTQKDKKCDDHPIKDKQYCFTHDHVVNVLLKGGSKRVTDLIWELNTSKSFKQMGRDLCTMKIKLGDDKTDETAALKKIDDNIKICCDFLAMIETHF